LTKEKRNEKQAGPEEKTFPVPFLLEERNPNIASTPSKEKIIIEAFKFHSQGNISEAAKYYQYFINQGFKDHRVFSNYGIILKKLGNLEEAELLYRKAIKVNPNFADAHSNLGNILKDLGKLREAELSTRKAIELNPDFADAYYNLGIILKDLGKLQDAEVSARKAIKLNPDYANAHFNLGIILDELNRPREALKCFLNQSYTSLEEINKCLYISLFLKRTDPNSLAIEDLRYIFNILINKDNISHDILFNSFNRLYQIESLLYLDNSNKILESKDFKIFSNDQIVMKSLERIVFKSQSWENMLSKIREEICYILANEKRGLEDIESKFLISLAHQCFINEYVFYFSKEELKYTEKIIKKLNKSEENKELILILGCYYPLYKLTDRIPFLKSFKSSDIRINRLLKLQILDPLKERELSKKIKRIGHIDDETSKRVLNQYEKRPFPAWRNTFDYHKLQKDAYQKINDDIKPNFINTNFKSKELNILIAGCGTGQQVLQATAYKNSQITAIELSLSSLAYAKRKINEIGINNVGLIQMDILELSLMKEKFDLIECTGVLHHMKDIDKGLRALLQVLDNNGFLKLGIYSQKARRKIQSARDYIKSKQIEVNENNLREFRMSIINGCLPELKSYIRQPLFYTMSGIEDLFFHTQEHQFNLHELQDMLEKNRLIFHGFVLPKDIKYKYKKYFPEDKTQTNLQNWGKFEEKYTRTFSGMYNFWVSKSE
tara:strand:+ start:508 stop:2673 length:2166 start_codon:yes stop_codon:yes gene_type:complete